MVETLGYRVTQILRPKVAMRLMPLSSVEIHRSTCPGMRAFFFPPSILCLVLLDIPNLRSHDSVYALLSKSQIENKVSFCKNQAYSSYKSKSCLHWS